MSNIERDLGKIFEAIDGIKTYIEKQDTINTETSKSITKVEKRQIWMVSIIGSVSGGLSSVIHSLFN